MPGVGLGLSPVLLGGGVSGGGAGVTPFDFDAGAVTFTAKMAKRTAPGPFAVAPVVQGKWDGSGTLDDVRFTGSVISGSFHSIYDGYQGSIVFWITPEWDGNDGLNHYVLRSGVAVNVLKSSSGTLDLSIYDGTAYRTVTTSVASWTAGTTYCVVARWDRLRTLDGTNYMAISINDSHAFGYSSALGSYAGSGTGVLGSSSAFTNAADALIEGLTIYRRPLFDGTYGVDVGNGDELAAIYASGAGKDPTEVTGSWDVVFCLPTNATAGELVTGTGEAWTHPHASAVLDDTFCQTTYASSAWDMKGSPTTGPADAATADKVFAWGYDFEASADGDGISQSLTGLTAGQSYVIRALAHEDAAADIRVRVYDDTNSADIVTFLFGSGSSVAAPGVALFTWELPTAARNGVGSDCTAMTVSIEGTTAGQVVTVHQVEVQVIDVDNPGLETGSGDPWIPDGFTNDSLTAGESSQETSVQHSGSACFRINAGATAYRTVHWGGGSAPIYNVPTYMAVGIWLKSDGSGFASQNVTAATWSSQAALTGVTTNRTVLASWTHFAKVYRLKTNGARITFSVSNNTATGNTYFDNAYAFPMTPVSLTVTPASQANSAETSGLRVDGLDTCTQVVANLSATTGRVRWNYTPRHDAADAVKLGNAAAYVASLYGAADNYIRVYWSAANTITLAFNGGGGEHTATWDATGAIAAGTSYTLQLDYSASEMTLSVDDVVKATITTGISFATVPTTAYWGSTSAGASQADATLAAPA